MRMRTIAACALVGGALCFASACAPATPKLEPPAQIVQQLLELRASDATDRAEYLRYVESTSVAAALAADSMARKSESPVPDWQTPEVAESDTLTARVKVAWKPSEQFRDWPVLTMFRLVKADGRWRVVDAIDAASTAK